MDLSSLKQDQLEAFLAKLTPEAARVLVREVERDRLRGQNNFPHDFLLKQARSVFDGHNAKFERIGSPRRFFCDAFEDMLVDTSTNQKQPGRVLRSSIEPVWQWLVNDLAGDVLGEVNTALTSAILDGDKPAVDLLTAKMRQITARAIQSAVRDLDPMSKNYLRVSARLGGTRVLEDAKDIALALSVGDLRREVIDRLPRCIEKLKTGDVADYVGLLREKCSAGAPAMTIGLLAIMRRLDCKTDILRIAKEVVGQDQDVAIQRSICATACGCLLHDMELPARNAIDMIRNNAPVPDIHRELSRFYILAEGYDTELEVDLKGEWGQRLVEVRSELSRAINSKIEATPRVIKTALFRAPRAAGPDDVAAGAPPLAWPDPEDLREARFLVGLLVVVRSFLSQLPINTEVAKVSAEVRQFLDVLGENVVNDIRTSLGEARACAEAYLEATAELTEMVFGGDAGDLLRRRGKAAMQADLDMAL